MTRQRRISAGLVLLAMTLFLSSSFSQARRSTMRRGPMPRQRPGRMTREQRMERLNQAKAQAFEQGLKEALAVKAAQWAVIEPKLRRVRELRDQAEAAVAIKNGVWITTTETLRGDRAVAAGGKTNEPLTTTARAFEQWSYTKPWESKASLLGAEKACDDLVSLIESGNATDEQKKAGMDALRQARNKAGEELVLAQDELQKVLSLRQQTTLFLMGWLD